MLGFFSNLRKKGTQLVSAVLHNISVFELMHDILLAILCSKTHSRMKEYLGYCVDTLPRNIQRVSLSMKTLRKGLDYEVLHTNLETNVRVYGASRILMR